MSLAAAQPVTDRPAGAWRRAQPWLGTLVEIAATGEADACADAMTRGFAAIGRVQALMSFQDPASELSRVNREAARDWVALSPDTATVLAAALDFARESDGLFDPSVAAWLVDSGHLPRHLPQPASSRPDWRAIELDGDRVRYARPLLVDLSGIAKGYAVDVALAELRAAGVESACVNAGGDLARFGSGTLPIRVRDPRAPVRSLMLAELGSGAVATSAGYFQPGALRHPLQGETLCAKDSVTVLAAACMSADALTKVVAAAAGHAPALLARYAAQALVFDGIDARLADASGWHSLPLQRPADPAQPSTPENTA